MAEVSGRLLKMLFGDARSETSGQPGADAPTHGSRRSTRKAATLALSTSAARVSDLATMGHHRVASTPSGTSNRRCYKPDWCTVEEVDPGPGELAASGRRTPVRCGVRWDGWVWSSNGVTVSCKETTSTSTPPSRRSSSSRRGRRPTEPSTSTPCADAVTSPCSCSWTSRDLPGSPAPWCARARPSARHGRQPWLRPCMSSATAWRSMGSDRRGARPCTSCRSSDSTTISACWYCNVWEDSCRVRIRDWVQRSPWRGRPQEGGGHGTKTPGGALRWAGLRPRLRAGLRRGGCWRALAEARRQGIGCVCLSVGTDTDSRGAAPGVRHGSLRRHPADGAAADGGGTIVPIGPPIGRSAAEGFPATNPGESAPRVREGTA